MNREIKFRAWSEKNKEMYFPDENYCFRIYNDSIGFYPHHSSDDLYYFNTNPCDGELKIDVMQYTGLKDKNGKEIYEGDIVKQEKWIDVGEYIETIGVVKYLGIKFTSDCVGDWEGSNAELNGNASIIGNIYENPELLEAKKDQLSDRKVE